MGHIFETQHDYASLRLDIIGECGWPRAILASSRAQPPVQLQSSNVGMELFGHRSARC